MTFTTGTVPNRLDTEWSLWARILIRMIQLRGNNNHKPTIHDTRRQLIEKVYLTLY